MRKTDLTPPYINPKLFYGPILSYDTSDGIVKTGKTYSFRFTVVFSSGDVKKIQRGGFTKAQAATCRDAVIASLASGEFIPYEYTPKEVFQYYLYGYKGHFFDELEKPPYNTFMSYRNIITNYLVPFFRDKCHKQRFSQIGRNEILNFLSTITRPSILKEAGWVLRDVFRMGRERNLTLFHPDSAICAYKKKWMKEYNLTREKRRPVILTEETASRFLFYVRENDRRIYPAVLLALTCGLRISEAAAVKFESVDFTGLSVHVTAQLGRKVHSGRQTDFMREEIPLKTKNARRSVPAAQWVIDELMMYCSRHGIREGYLSRDEKGRPFERTGLLKRFQKDALSFGGTEMEGIVFHDLRKSFSTMLCINGSVNLKAVSLSMGHSSEEFTKEVYVYQEPETKACRPSANTLAVFESLLPQDNTKVLRGISDTTAAFFIPVMKDETAGNS